VPKAITLGGVHGDREGPPNLTARSPSAMGGCQTETTTEPPAWRVSKLPAAPIAASALSAPT